MDENLPDDQVEENEDFAAMLDKSLEGKQERLAPGQMVEAGIVRISEEWVFLDTGRKSEGYLDKKELLDASGNLTCKEGDKIRAYYLPAAGHDMRFTTRIGHGPAGSAALQDAFKNGIPVQGTILKEIKGGFEVRIGDGIRAFCPFSQMGLAREQAPAEQVGKAYTFKITECGDRNVVVSRKAILDVERRQKVDELRKTLQEGMRLEGRVVSLQKFGAFVDIGGVQGLVPMSELAHSRVEKVEDKLSVGQSVEVVIKRLDWANGKISLSVKDALPDPWDHVDEYWPTGSYHNGTVTRLAPFGAFVALGEGVEGLLHISKLGGGTRRLSHAREVLKEGQGVEVRIDSVERDSRKIALSLASISREEEEAAAILEEYREKASSTTEGLGTLGSILGHSQDEDQGK